MHDNELIIHKPTEWKTKKMRMQITVKTRFSALHAWEDIPPDHPMQFLKTPHRHEFHVTAKWPVYHDNRDREFILAKQELDQFIATRWGPQNGTPRYIGSMSCEMLAQEIMDAFGCSYVQVEEDGENGAEVFAEVM